MTPQLSKEVLGSLIERVGKATGPDREIDRALSPLLRGHAMTQSPSPIVDELCATEGCDRPGAVRFERTGIGSIYCNECYAKIAALVPPPKEAKAEHVGAEVVAWRWRQKGMALWSHTEDRPAALINDPAWEVQSLYASPQPSSVGGDREVEVEYDGFAGTVIGSYATREGKRGVVVQQYGTRVVHVYGENRVKPAALSGRVE